MVIDHGCVPLVDITRADTIESLHQGVAVAVAADGSLLLALGDPATVAFLRSTAKPFQALPFAEAGGIARHGLDDESIALLCASHAGTNRHAAAVARLQQQTGVREDELGCGTHPPFDGDTAFALRRDGIAPGCNRHNCSGKHTGMIAAARNAGWSTADYLVAAHPLQRRILATLAAMAGMAPDAVRIGIDGCSAPNFAIPAQAAALAWARFADPADLSTERRSACTALGGAMMRAPEMIAGRGLFDTRLMQALPGRIISKGGAEGCQAFGLPAGVIHARGVGVFIKIADGDHDGRARRVLSLALLEKLGALDTGARHALADFGPVVPVVNARGTRCGEIRPRAGLFN